MTELRYAGLKLNGNTQRVTSIGTQTSASGGGDGWTQLQSLGTAGMPSGARSYALFISGKIGDRLAAGGGIIRGRAEVMLGTTGGQRHPGYVVNVPLQEPIESDSGIPFNFLVLISAADPDALFGSTVDLTSVDLCLYARTWTNGDAQTYYTEFTVADVSWLWFDLSTIPAGHFAQHRSSGPVNITDATFGNWAWTGAAAFGTAGEDWLHFATAHYRTYYWNKPAPHFRFGLTPSGAPSTTEVMIGNGDRFGFNRSPNTAAGDGQPTAVESHHGGFWVHTIANSTTRFGAAATQSGALTTLSEMLHVRHFAVRIDTLTDVLWVRHASQSVALPEANANWPANRTTLERPLVGLLTEPIVMATGSPTFVNQRAAYGVRVVESSNLANGFRETLKTEADATRAERAQAMAFGRRSFQVLSPAMQWRASWLGNAVAPAGLQDVVDVTMLQFHPVRDPENVTAPPGTEPSPIILVPAFQGPDPGDLPLPPIGPASNALELGRLERNRVRGATGYTRSWPMGARALRVISLSWGALSFADADSVFAFLRDNMTWQYVPPRGPALAVMNAVRPVMQQAGHNAFSIAIDVAVLRWTGS